MGILDHLWDDTVAGPRPDSGLGKLRKNVASTSRPSPGNTKGSDEVMSDRRSFEEDGVRVSRSIMIVKPPQGSQRDSPPASPAGSTPPASPFAGKDWLPINPSTAAMGPGQFSHSPVNAAEEEERRRSVSEEGRRRLHTRRHNDPGALLLLTTCDF